MIAKNSEERRRRETPSGPFGASSPERGGMKAPAPAMRAGMPEDMSGMPGKTPSGPFGATSPEGGGMKAPGMMPGMIPEGNVAVARSLETSAVPDRGEIEPFQRLPISRPEIAEAMQTLQTYRAGKANLETRLVENQQWYKLRQWECLRKGKKGQVEPSSAWLLNAIANKHADAMDNFPCANVLPREAGDEEEAKRLSSIIPVVLDHCDFEEVYSIIQDDKLQSGTGVYGVFWNGKALNGLGDVQIEAVDLIQLFWESGITDIQDSRNLFYVTLQDNDLLEQSYPELKDRLSNPTIDLNLYVYDDTIDTNGKSAVVDWYYKKSDESGRTLLHYCKFVAGQPEPLFATENDPEYADRGWYDHGEYPFVFDRLMRCKGTPTGFGYIDIGKSVQEYIDRGDQAILQNMLFNARPRHFIRADGAVNEAEFADATKDFIHVDGNLGEDSIKAVQPNPLNSVYVTIQTNKIQELKETTGNRDVSNGGTTGGATAASAIAAMQEAGSKLSRDNNQGSFRAFRKVVLMCIELIRQFYDVPRWFRILGEGGEQSFVHYSNAAIKPQAQGPANPETGYPEDGYRLPLFDLEVSAEKNSPYTKMATNELALQLYGAGFFAPNNADAALACLEMMDFRGRDKVIRQVSQNQTLQDMLQQTQQLALGLAQQVDGLRGTNLAPQLAAQIQAAGMQLPAGTGSVAPVDLDISGESSVTKNARQRVAESTAPR